MKDEASIRNLINKIDVTTKTRFHASRRLRLHSTLSTYSVVLISLSLILISLMQAYDLGLNINSPKVGLIQVFSSVAVLVYSLLIDKNDYSSLAEKMYACASKLGELKREMHPFVKQAHHDQQQYEYFVKEYHKILDLYETHSNNDFRGDYFRTKLEVPEHYEIKGLQWLIVKSEVILLYILDFKSYPLVAGVLATIIYWLWFGF